MYRNRIRNKASSYDLLLAIIKVSSESGAIKK